MPFNSLANIFLLKHGNTCVAFTENNKIGWDQLLTDVSLLTLAIKKTKAYSVAICCDNSYLFLVAFFAVIYAQKRVVLPGNHQPEMLKSLSSEFELLIDDGLLKVSDKECIDKHFITLPLEKQSRSAFAFYPLDLNKTNVVLFTSGSTGKPKAVNKTLQMLEAEIQGLEHQFGVVLGKSSIVSTVSHQHIYGLLFRVLWPFCTHRPFATTDFIYTEQVIDNAMDQKVLISSPALLKRLPNDKKTEGYIAVFSSGGPLSADAAELCKYLLSKSAIEVFGSTETGGIAFRQQESAKTPWTLFENVNVKVGSESCLALISPWLNKELINTSDGYYQTSDQCDLLDGRKFELKGRIDRIVKIEEKRVSLVEVETHLNELDWITESAVIVISEPNRIVLGALLTLTKAGEQELVLLGKGKFWIKLRQALRNWIEPVAIPRYFRITSEIPMNKQGKRQLQDIVGLFK